MSTYDQDLLFRVVNFNNRCQPKPDWSFETDRPNIHPTSEIVTRHVAQFSFDTGLISATHNLLFAIFFAYRKSRARNSTLGPAEVEIFFLSNEKQYRSPAVQLDLKIPSIRQEYLKHHPENPRFLKYPSKNLKFSWAFDLTKEADEVVIPGRIPAHRVLGRCTLTDLQTKCDMSWLFDVFRDNQKYHEALSQLPNYDEAFLQKMAVSAKKLRSLCEIRETTIASLNDNLLFNALIDGLNKSRNVSLWTLAKGVWDPSFCYNIDIGIEREAARQPESESLDVEEDLDKIFSSMSLVSNLKSLEVTILE